jgi:tetratricopeptide (TPR) repeat protein
MSAALDELVALGALAEEAGRPPPDPGRTPALARLRQRLGDVRHILAQVPSSDAECDAARRLAVALAPLWPALGDPAEGRRHLTTAAAWPGGTGTWRARAADAAGRMAYAQGDFAEAEARFAACLSLFEEGGDEAAATRVLDRLGLVAREMGRYEEARDCHARALARWRGCGPGVALALGNLGVVARELGRLGEARALLTESLALRRGLGDALGAASALGNLGVVSQLEGRLVEAAALHEECLALRRSLADHWGVAAALNNLGAVERCLGRTRQARRLHAEALGLIEGLNDRLGLCETLEAVAGVQAAEGDPVSAARLLGAAEGLRAALGARRPPSRQPDHDRVSTAVRASLGVRMPEPFSMGEGLDQAGMVRLLREVLEA